MRKPTFLGHDRPLLTDMVLTATPEEFSQHVRTGIYDGADAFGMQLEQIDREARTEPRLREAFSFLADKPLYVCNYRKDKSAEMGEDERMDELKLAVRCGATLVDVPGDTYAPDPMELTKDAAAIDRQMKLVDEFHAMGAEVLMSSHVHKFLPEAEVVELALEQQRRGADIAKFVTWSGTEDELHANLRTIRALKRELKIPFLFLSGGPWCKMHRQIGPFLGVCMWLCVDEYQGPAYRSQPLLKAMRAVRDNLDLVPFRA